MYLHLLLVTTFLCVAAAQQETLRGELVEKGGNQIGLDQPDQQAQSGILSSLSLNNDTRRSGGFLVSNIGSARPIRRKKPFRTNGQGLLDDNEYDYDDNDGIADSLPETGEPGTQAADNSSTLSPDSSYEGDTEPKGELTGTPSSETTTLASENEKTTVAETNSTKHDKTTTVITTRKPALNATTTQKPSPGGKSIWRSPLVIWIAIITLAIIVLAVQMPTILYLLCCRGQAQTSEVLLSDSQTQPVNQAQTVTQQQLKSLGAPPMDPLGYTASKAQAAVKFLPTLGVQQQQKQNDTAAMSDAFGTSMNSDAESGYANAPIRSAAMFKPKPQQTLPKLSYTASNVQKTSSTSAKKNQAGKSNGKSKKAAARK